MNTKEALVKFVTEYQGISEAVRLVFLTLIERSRDLSRSVAVHFFLQSEGEKTIWEEIYDGDFVNDFNEYTREIECYTRFMTNCNDVRLGGRISLQHTGSSGNVDLIMTYGPGLGMKLHVSGIAGEPKALLILSRNGTEICRRELQLSRVISVMAGFAQHFPGIELDVHIMADLEPHHVKTIVDEMVGVGA